MGTTKTEIAQRLLTAKANGAKYLIMVCDTFSYEDYGVQCKDAKECLEKIEHYDGKNMQRSPR